MVICKNWIEVIFKKIFGLSIKSIKLRNGIIFIVGGTVPKADLSMLKEIWFDKVYTSKEIGINSTDIVFDIGANNGFFSVFVSKLAYRGKVFCFEPLPSLYNKIIKNIEINKTDNIVLENIAIAEREGSVDFFESKIHNGCHSLFRRSDTDNKIQVEAITLEKYVLNNNISQIDFLKMDCEGAEYGILFSLSDDFLTHKIKKISLEYHDDVNEHNHKELVDFLVNHNYKVLVKDGLIYALNNR